MSEATENAEQQQEEDLNVFLRKAQVELDTAKGVIRESKVLDDKTVRTLTVKRPGYDDDHPDVYLLEITTPKSITQPITTKLTRKWTACVPDVDVENYTHSVVFSTKPNIIGGIPKTTIIDSSDDMVGTKTTYADSNTPRFRYEKLKNPIQTAKDILGKLKTAPVTLSK